MFYFIEPEEHYLYKGHIFPFLEKLADNPKLYDAFEDWNQASFLLSCDKGEPTLGGALLVQQSIEALHPRIQEHTRTFYPNMKDVWSVIISLQVHKDITGRDFEKICKIFYSSLISELVAFAISKGTPFLCVTMTPTEYLTIAMCNFWHYTVKVKPELSRDKLFHGVLTFLKME